MFGECSLRWLATPFNVPPVPYEQKKYSNGPSASSLGPFDSNAPRISGPVVVR